MSEAYGVVRYDRLAEYIKEKLEDTIKTKVAEALSEKFLTFLDGTQIMNPRFFYKIYEGRAFSISRRFENIASDNSINLYFQNPSGSGMKLLLS